MEKINIKDQEINRETRSKILLGFLDSAEDIKPFNGKKFEDIFSNEESKREFIRNLTKEDFFSLIVGLNGVLRGIKKEDFTIQEKEVQLSGGIDDIITPKAEDKPELLEELLSKIKAMNKSGKSLEDIALLVSSSINAIHIFPDGNGRISRFLYKILVNDFNSENMHGLRDLLSTDGRLFLDINPGIIKLKIEEIIDNEINFSSRQDLRFIFGGFYKNVNENEKDKTFFNYIKKSDGEILARALFVFSIKNDFDLEKLRLLETDRINGEKLVEILTNEQLASLLQEYRILKKRYVEILMDCIVSSEKDEYQIGEGDEKISLKSYFEKEIKKTQEESKDLI